MQKRSSESRKIALSGVFGSLAAVLMLMGGILPQPRSGKRCFPMGLPTATKGDEDGR